MLKKENLLLLGIILINFSLQSFNPFSFTFKNYYEWDGLSNLFPDFIANKIIRLGLNLAGLNLLIGYKNVNWSILLAFSLCMAILLSIYFSSYLWFIPIEISKFLNPILFSPLLVIGSFAYKLAGQKTQNNDS